MPFNRCIAAALADQLITEDEHDDFQATYREYENDFRRLMPPHEAAAEAARETFRFIEDSAAERRRQTFLRLAAQQESLRRLDSFKDKNGKSDPYAAARAHMDRMVVGRAGELSVEGQHEFWRNEAQRELEGAYTTYGRNMLGQRRNWAGQVNIVRELAGQRTGDNAAEMLAAGWKRASEQLRQAFNRFGGHIGKLEDWLLPQIHDMTLVRRAGFENWAAAITPMLDRGRMVDRLSGQPLGDAELHDALNKAYLSIITDGWADRDVTSRRAGALANRRDDHRFLHFKDADNWLAYQRQFGEGDVINAMLGHIDRMSRDVGLLQVMGPNPVGHLAWLKNELTKRAALSEQGAREIAGNNPISRAKDRVARRLEEIRGVSPATQANGALEKMYAAYANTYAAPVHPLIANIVDDISNVLTSAQLGSAVLMAGPSDINFQRMARSFNGLPEVKMLTQYLKQLNPLNPEHRLAAIRMGLGAEHYGQVLGMQGRYTGLQVFGHKWSRWLSDRVLTASGLSPWSSAGRHIMGMTIFGEAADQAPRSFGQLDKNFAGMLTRYGIGAKDWDTLRATPAYDAAGAPFIRPADVMARTDLDQGAALTLAGKLSDMAQTEAHFAVMTSTLASRAAMQGWDRPGSFKSLANRSLAMYRTFGAGVMLSHGRRMASLTPNPAKIGSYAASLIITSMLAGAITNQAKEIANGRDPRDMTDWRFWLAAFVTGGGGGLLSDFVYAGLQGQDSAGEGLAGVALGPLGAFAQDALTTVMSSKGIGAASNKPSASAKNFPTRALEFAKRYAPGGNLWYAKLAVERAVWDQLQDMVDPGYKSRVPRIERWQRQQYGNSYFWHGGELAPERAPDPASAIGGQQ